MLTAGRRPVRAALAAAVGAAVLAGSATTAGAATAGAATARPTAARAVTTNVDDQLAGVSCPSANFCVAVGQSGRTTGPTTTVAPLAESWNGTTWSVMTLPTLKGVTSPSFAGVSCASTTSCMAVLDGSFPPGATLAEAWNGKVWTVLTSLPGDRMFTAVSCARSTPDCMAVGFDWHPTGQNQTLLAASWNGKAWTVLDTPSPPNIDTIYPEFTAVSCTAPDACMAVGNNGDVDDADSVAERWNGQVWTYEPTPFVAAFEAGLAGISCPSATSCTAVGSVSGLEGIEPVAGAWNGARWASTLNNVPLTVQAELNGVACFTSLACLAVGSGDGFSQANFWNGKSWTGLKIGSPGNLGFGLSSVSLTSGLSAIAVGTYSTIAGAIFTLAELWNGSSWKVLSTPNP